MTSLLGSAAAIVRNSMKKTQDILRLYYNGGEKPHRTRRGSGRTGVARPLSRPAGTKLARAAAAKQLGLRHKRHLKTFSGENQNA